MKKIKNGATFFVTSLSLMLLSCSTIENSDSTNFDQIISFKNFDFIRYYRLNNDLVVEYGYGNSFISIVDVPYTHLSKDGIETITFSFSGAIVDTGISERLKH